MIIFINLDKREDRRREMENELKRLGVSSDKIIRWKACENDNPALGCTLSHIEVLKYIQQLPEDKQNILILEDDFNFVDNLDQIRNSIKQFLNYPRELWDMVLLGYYVRRREDFDGLISRCFFAQWTAGYMINRSCIPRLLSNFEEGRDGIVQTGRLQDYSIDVYWHKFMQDRKTFFFNKALGYQRKSFSDISNLTRECQSYACD